jgi:RNA polymerase sigma-70 factor (ECF subfamily)
VPITSRSKLVEIPVEVTPPPPPPSPSPVEFDAFYREHLDFVWRSLRRFGVADATLDDATQEVFLVVYRRFHEFRPESSARAWLFAIAHRTASTHRRWVKRKGNLMPLHDEFHATSGSPLDGAITRQAGDLVLAFLDELDEARRVAFILSDLEQMTAPEIAAAVNVNVNTIYYRIASARKAFVAYLERRRIGETGEGS